MTSIIDRIYYGHWVLVPFNFLKFNVISGQGTFYGAHAWHWYVTQGFPVIMGSHLLLFVAGLKHLKLKLLVPFYLIVWTILIYRFVPLHPANLLKPKSYL